MVTIKLLVFVLGVISKESILIVSAISTSADNFDDEDDDMEEGDKVEIVDDAGLCVLLDQLSSARGFCLTSLALVM